MLFRSPQNPKTPIISKCTVKAANHIRGRFWEGSAALVSSQKQLIFAIERDLLIAVSAILSEIGIIVYNCL